ncbi:tripartite tricarboxylate transporter substrate binding protein [Variovorax sp. J22P240]|uniref:Bug family tripartite tricarboxylate transporter substrate binding protein n=1 Tax=unclassified Variovorax TaxID=663243 RepID=UPI002577F523|nr:MULTISPECIES: tripartite tricarboxylate transporter substrate binding protein [unclassified Variovorax]MDL9997500.1 tripartite tricarboxylate transporter substrate binding protein [Variovorax sp. J22P240]MDM0051536.1 tripartite tricarboxylate transporter substrate binding protein [Variovorax sp. J22R115]
MTFDSKARRTLCAAMFIGASLFAPGAQAQAPAKWPEKPLRIVVAGPAGGSADVIARVVADGLSREIGQPVIVDPKPGAAGVLAVNELSQAPHDGHTLLVGVNSLVSEIPHIVNLKVDMATEIKPVAELARGGLVMVGTPSLPARNFGELMAWVKAQPGKVNYASYTAGTVSHVLGLQLNKAAGIDMAHVGYKGSTPALTDVMGGHVQLMFDGMATSLPLIKAGKLKAFAVSTPKRNAALPDVPTFAELGYPQLEAIGWMGLWIKPDVPAPVQARLRDAVLKVLAQPAVRERIEGTGLEAGQPRSPEQMSKSLQADYARMGEVLKSINFKPE